jgi:hypothetical protein
MKLPKTGFFPLYFHKELGFSLNPLRADSAVATCSMSSGRETLRETEEREKEITRGFSLFIRGRMNR